MPKSGTVAQWLAEQHVSWTVESRAIAAELNKLSDVEDYQFAIQPTYEGGASPKNCGLLYEVRCVPDHIDRIVIAYTTMRPWGA
jgi:hypothetical protein